MLLLSYLFSMAENSIEKKPRAKKEHQLLTRFYDEDVMFELSIDEAGRGCLFGRVYIACVVLPKEPLLFDGTNIKDSKKFSSKTKLNEVAEYIKENAFAWHIAYEESKIVDDINILQAVMKGMHNCIREIRIKINNKTNKNYKLTDFMAVIDGNYFTPFRSYEEEEGCIVELPFNTVEKGDAKYMAIAAASILAKTARDQYVIDMCAKYTFLNDHYSLSKNMGYGTKLHLNGIREYGITRFHRHTFGLCKTAEINNLDNSFDEDPIPTG
jgi:ribonuclease HII